VESIISDTEDDSAIESVIEAVSRRIDEATSRRFYQELATTRYFSAEWADLLHIPDLVTLTTLKTDEDGDRVYETTWASTDYDLEPFNAALVSKPYTAIHVAPNGRYVFPLVRKSVEIVGTWGWPAVPKIAKEACLLQSFRVFKRKDAPFGVAGSIEIGQLQVISKLDPDVTWMLEPLRRLSVVAI
jgi:hypothetical protein